MEVSAQLKHVVIFDKPSDDQSGLGIGRTPRAELERAVAICRRTGAGLLVYRNEAINQACLSGALGLNACATSGGVVLCL
jgi:hypothetical protein